MGICSICWSGCAKIRPKRRIVLILIGLDNAGKTQTVNSLTGVEETVMPTVGFKAVNLVHRSTPVTVYDLGGGAQFRSIWHQYYSEVHGVVFVIDSSDGERMEECRSVLAEVISHERIAGKPILILANKQDKSGALDDIDIVEKLGIERLVNRYRCPTLVESYTAAPEQPSKKKRQLDPGLKKGYLWLLNYIVSRYGDINLRVQTDIHAELERRKRQSANHDCLRYTDESIATGFENPHYVTLSRDTTPNTLEAQAKSLEDGIIVVKPIQFKDTDNSGNSDGDLDVNTAKHNNSKYVNSSEVDSTKSGRNTDTTISVSNSKFYVSDIVVEPENSRRVQNGLDVTRIFSNYEDVELNNLEDTIVIEDHIDDKDSSLPNTPSPEPRTKMSSAVERKPAELDIRSRPRSSPSVKALRVETRIQINRSSDSPDERIHTSTDNTTPPAKMVTSEGTLQICPPKMEDGEVRPASASQLVRRQLEVVSAVAHRRRFSLRYPLRNKTSPLPAALFHYEPGKEGEGDFALRRRAPSGDVTL